MFELQRTEVKCTSTSTNSENMGGGDETRLGISLYIEFQGSNEYLDQFDPKLRPALYERAGDDAQEDLTGHLPALKFKLDKPLHWPYIGQGYTAVIHPEFDVNEELQLKDCKLDKFQFALHGDGVVGYKFRVYANPNLDDVGPLCALEKHTLQLSLIPPSVAPVDERVDEQAEPSPQADLLDAPAQEAAPAVEDKPRKAKAKPVLLTDEEREIDVLYPRALAAVRATGNPSANALQLELKTTFNHALRLLARMADEGVIVERAGEYVLAEEAEALGA